MNPFRLVVLFGLAWRDKKAGAYTVCGQSTTFIYKKFSQCWLNF